MKWELLATPHSQEWHPERAGLHVCRPFPVGFFKDADSHVAPPSDLGTAVGAGDNAPIGRMGRDGESIAATLTAPEGAGVRVRLDWLRHDTASILVSRTTAGEEWLNGDQSILKTASVKGKSGDAECRVRRYFRGQRITARRVLSGFLLFSYGWANPQWAMSRTFYSLM